jgi:hypothetical protein
MLQYLIVGTHRVPFETDGRATPFSSVAKILGGEAKAKAYSMDTPIVCYRLSGSATPTILVFIGDDMGSEVLSEFEVVPASSKPELIGKCAALNVLATQVATDRGIRLGLSRAEVEGKLGKTHGGSEGTATYETTEVRTAKGDGPVYVKYRITSGITITYTGGRVVAFTGGISDED